MLRDITLYEFNSLNDNEKYEAMMDYALLGADRKENHCNVSYNINLTTFTQNFIMQVGVMQL